MRHLRRLGVLGCTLVLVLGCGRTRSAGDDFVGPESDPSREDTGSMGSADGAGSGGTLDGDGSSSSGSGTEGDGTTDGRSSGGTPKPTSGLPDGTNDGTDGDSDGDPDPNVAGSGSVPMQPPSEDDPPAGMEGENPAAVGVLNPQRCATDEPFVLSIDPGGASGEVRGWLESAPNVIFDKNDLPSFGASFDLGSNQNLTMWWSIAALDVEPSLWLYATNPSTEIAHVPVRNVAEIGDARALTFVGMSPDLDSVGPVALGELVVFHHGPTDRFIALQAFDMYGTEDSDRRELCAAIDARWFVAPHGTGDFSGFD